MISVDPPALHQALQLLRTPSGARPGPQERLPEGMLPLIRIVAGDEQALADARQSSGEAADVLREAAAFYIQQVMFASGSHSYRLLGVDADAPDERIKEHYRWLVRWLHPDRNADEWEVVYADRVNRAWQDLRTPEKRQRFDDTRAAIAVSIAQAQGRASGEWPAASPAVRNAVPVSYEDGAADYNALRFLPKLIFGGLGICAVLALGLLWLLRTPEPGRLAEPTVQTADVEPAPPVMASAPAPIVATEPVAPATSPVVDVAETLPAEASPTTAAVPAAVAPAVAVAAPVVADKTVRAVPAAPVLQPPAPIASRNPSRKSEPAIVAAAPPKEAPALVAKTRAGRRAAAPAAAVPSVVASPAAETPVAVAAARVEAAEPVPALPRIDDRIANRLVGQLSQAYGDGDMQRMQTLLASNATGREGQLLAEYSRLFATSEQRSLSISNVSWLQDGDNATIIATYTATVQARAGKRLRRTGGDMRLDLRIEGGQWRIYRLSHDERRG